MLLQQGCSALNWMCERYTDQTERIRKGCLFCQKWYMVYISSLPLTLKGIPLFIWYKRLSISFHRC